MNSDLYFLHHIIAKKDEVVAVYNFVVEILSLSITNHYGVFVI